MKNNSQSNFSRAENAAELLGVLDNENKFIVLRDSQGIINGTYRDIDLLSIDKSFKIKKVLNALSSSNIKIFRFIKRYKYYQIICFKEEWNKAIILDIWCGLRIKGCIYFDHKKLPLMNFKKFKNIKETTEEFSNFIAITKCLTQSGKIKKKYLNKMTKYEYINLSKNLIKENYLFLMGKSKLVINLLLFLKFFDRKQYYHWFLSVIKFSLIRKNILIYLIGPDGSGKSTLSKFIINSTNLRTKFIYSHGGLKILPRLSDLISIVLFKPIIRENKSTPELAIKSMHTKVNGKYTMIHLLYYSLDSIILRIKIFLISSRDLCYVADRCNYDILARDYYTTLPKCWQLLLVLLTPKPDFCFILKGDPVEINKRKPELTVEAIAKQYKNYEFLKRYVITYEIPTNNFLETKNNLTKILKVDL